LTKTEDEKYNVSKTWDESHIMPSDTEKTRINNRLPVAREGLPFIALGLFITVLFTLLGLETLALLAGLLTFFVIYFFRDPARRSQVSDKTVLTPADGTILRVQHFEDDDNPLGEPTVKISVFMSLFNVHVNRVPIVGKVSEIVYQPGKFFSAYLDKASEKNEKNLIALQTGDGRKIVFVQIAGLIARRIVCWIKEGDHVKTGQRFGLIRFGSRLDIYLPKDTRVTVQPRDKVKAGETVLGHLS
jgi:phosphatidylserine decarboxylase